MEVGHMGEGHLRVGQMGDGRVGAGEEGDSAVNYSWTPWKCGQPTHTIV